MKTVQHPQHSTWIGAPIDWNPERDGPCGALSVQEIPKPPYHPTRESAWEMEINEAICMMLGIATIRLGVIGQQQHPPVYMSLRLAGNAFDDRTATKAAYQKALAALIGHMEANGYTPNLSDGIKVYDIHPQKL